MRELTEAEIKQVSGGGVSETWAGIRQVIRELPDAYREAIQSTTDMMCTGTGNC